MGHTAYPQDSDVQAFVQTQGALILPDNYSFVGFGALGSQMWEQQSGYVPFLQETTATSRYYDPPGDRPNSRSFANFQYGGSRVLQLNAALVNAAAIESVTQMGQVATLWQDYSLYPKNADANKRPFTHIVFTTPFWGLPGSCVVTAQWGVQTQLSEDVWQGILRLCGSVALIDIAENMEQGLIKIKQGDEQFELSPQNIADLGRDWEKQGLRLMQPYKNTTAGFIN